MPPARADALVTPDDAVPVAAAVAAFVAAFVDLPVAAFVAAGAPR